MAASTMADAVALCRAAEKSKAVYCMAENYPYSRGCFELKRIVDGGTLGKVIFAEGEYVHPMGPSDTFKYHDPKTNGLYHWRRYNPATYYCSHALAPLIYATGEHPKRVVAMTALDSDERIKEFKKFKCDAAGVMLINTDRGSVFRVNGSTSCAPHGNWYRISGTKGGVETVRGNQKMIRLCYNSWSKPEGAEGETVYVVGEDMYYLLANGEMSPRPAAEGGCEMIFRGFLRLKDALCVVLNETDYMTVNRWSLAKLEGTRMGKPVRTNVAGWRFTVEADGATCDFVRGDGLYRTDGEKIEKLMDFEKEGISVIGARGFWREEGRFVLLLKDGILVLADKTA